MTMALIYVAGIVSGVILVVIALAGWIGYAARQIKERNNRNDDAGPTPRRTLTSAPAMANHRAHRHRRRRGTRAAAA